MTSFMISFTFILFLRYGRIKFKDLRSTHIQSVYNSCVKKNLSASAIKHVHTVFNQALKQAMFEELIFSNPATNTTRPKVVHEEVTVFTAKQQEQLINSLSNDTLGVIIKMAISTGMRIGELLGLKWVLLSIQKCTFWAKCFCTKLYIFI